MSKINDNIKNVLTELASHVQTYPDDIGPWRTKFDELRADLERLEFARSHPVPSSSVGPIFGKGS